jgi:hypothetical protein
VLPSKCCLWRFLHNLIDNNSRNSHNVLTVLLVLCRTMILQQIYTFSSKQESICWNMSPPMFFWIPDSELVLLSLSIASMDSCIIFLMSKIRTRLRPNCTRQWDVPTGISMTTSSMGAWIWVTQHQGLICQHWRWFLWSTTASCKFCFQVQLLHPKHMLTFPYRTKFCKLPVILFNLLIVVLGPDIGWVLQHFWIYICCHDDEKQ